MCFGSFTVQFWVEGFLFPTLPVATLDITATAFVGWMLVCGLAGGLFWGRKHRRQWDRENDADALYEEAVRSWHE
jgi:hypothetical protein